MFLWKRAVIPGRGEAVSPEPMNARLIGKSSNVLANRDGVHGFRAQACGLPRNDAVAPCKKQQTLGLLWWNGHALVIPDKPRSGADPGSIGGLRSFAMDPGSPLRCVRDDAVVP
jgi:hypothetical protein